MLRHSTAKVGAAVAVIALALAGCSAAGKGDASGEGNSGLPIVAVSSFPLAYIAQQVGGDQVEILNLASTSGHAHDMELSPSQVNQLGGADIVLYLSEGFQPGVETAITQTGVESLDGFAVLAQDDKISGDPHVWMDPLNIAHIGEELSTVLNEANPEAGAYYKENALELSNTMDQIDAEYARTLANCTGETLLTAHEAFGYLADRYGLDQVGVLGVDPEAEPSPARLRQVAELIKDQDIKVLFAEPAGGGHDHGEGENDDEEGDSHQAQTVSSSGEKIAATLGIPALVLDPMEVAVDPESTIPDVFASNLISLRNGLSCAVQ